MTGKSERNAAIEAAHRSGETMKALAQRYGISASRVFQIVHREARRRRDAERQRFCAGDGDGVTLSGSLSAADDEH